MGGGLVNNNNMAFILGLALIMSVFLVVSYRRTLLRIFFGICTLILVLGVLLLKSRGVWVGITCSVVGGILLLRGGGIGKRTVLILVIGVLGLGGAFSASRVGLLGEGVQKRASSVFEQGFEAGGRIDYWKAHATTLVKTGGIGLGYGQVSFKIGKVAHNDWFSIAGNLGVIRLICFAGFHLTILRRIRRMDQIWPKFSCLMMWIFIFVVPLTIDTFNKHRYTLAVGLILATVRLDERQRASELWTVDAGDA